MESFKIEVCGFSALTEAAKEVFGSIEECCNKINELDKVLNRQIVCKYKENLDVYQKKQDKAIDEEEKLLS